MHLPVRSLATLRCLRKPFAKPFRKALSQSLFAKPFKKPLAKQPSRSNVRKAFHIEWPAWHQSAVKAT